MAILVGLEIVIATTRYRTGLEPMVGKLGVLDGKGVPLSNGGDHDPTLPGLWFTGMRPNVRGCFANARIQTRHCKGHCHIAAARSAPAAARNTTTTHDGIRQTTRSKNPVTARAKSPGVTTALFHTGS